MADNIEIEIDGKKLTAKPNQMLIEVADAAGIYIPRFCYHKHLSIAANCRMCLVEVEKSPKTLPACATPVMPGMKVFTQSPKTIEAQRAVMEFLLINHPLDCPVCDQGGECELQDISMGYGSGISHYDESKRAVADEDLGSLIATEMTRCILCTRCVRFGAEVAGLRELGVVNRGGHAEISTFVERAMQSEISGNIIDICPVGALTSKPYQFTARAWELKQSGSIAAHDCLGSNINVHTLQGKVMRVVARENYLINQTWISDRDRFSYTGLNHADRLDAPMIRMHGKWQKVEWQHALTHAATKLQEACQKHGSEQVGALSSPNATVEEFYLLQKIMRGLNVPHIDHRLREQDTRDEEGMALFPGMSVTLDELEQSDAVILIGSNITREQPLAGLRVRKAVQNQKAAVFALNSVDYDFHFDVAVKEIVAPHALVKALKSFTDALQKKSGHAFLKHLEGKQKIVIIVGALAMHHPDAAVIRGLAQKMAAITGGSVSLMTDGANSAGAWIAGFVPHRQAAGQPAAARGLSAYDMLAKPRKAYVLMNVEPELDCANSAHAAAAFRQAECVIALSCYRDPLIEAHADVILPIAPFTETSGTFVNANGTWQSFKGCVEGFGATRPAWKVLRVLGNFLHLAQFDYESSEEVRDEVAALLQAQPMKKESTVNEQNIEVNDHAHGLSRIGEIPVYSIDSIVRRSEALHIAQTNMDGEMATVRIHPETARRLYLADGDLVKVSQDTDGVVLFVTLDERLARDAAWVAGGIAQTVGLSDLFGALKLEKVLAQ